MPYFGNITGIAESSEKPDYLTASQVDLIDGFKRQLQSAEKEVKRLTEIINLLQNNPDVKYAFTLLNQR